MTSYDSTVTVVFTASSTDLFQGDTNSPSHLVYLSSSLHDNVTASCDVTGAEPTPHQITLSLSDYGLAIGALLLFVIGVPGNVSAISVYITGARLRCPQNMFVVSLAVADCSTLLCAPIVVVNAFSDAIQQNSHFTCYVVIIFMRLSTQLGMINIAAIGFIRYVTIVHPTSRLAAFTWRNCALGIFGVWIYACAWTFVPIMNIGTSYVEYNVNMHICMLEGDALLTLLTLLFVYVASVLFVGYSYVRIYLTVRRSARRVHQCVAAIAPAPTAWTISYGGGGARVFVAAQEQARSTSTVPAAGAGKQARRIRHESRLAAQLMIIFGVFLICWAPFLSYTMFDRTMTVWLPQSVYNVFVIAIFVNSAVNPIIYLCYNSAYRKELKSLYYRCSCRALRLSTAVESTTRRPEVDECSVTVNGVPDVR